MRKWKLNLSQKLYIVNLVEAKRIIIHFHWTPLQNINFLYGMEIQDGHNRANLTYNRKIFCCYLKSQNQWTVNMVGRLTGWSFTKFRFLAQLAKGHVSFCHHLASIVRHKLSHLNLLLWNCWTKLNLTW